MPKYILRLVMNTCTKTPNLTFRLGLEFLFLQDSSLPFLSLANHNEVCLKKFRFMVKSNDFIDIEKFGVS